MTKYNCITIGPIIESLVNARKTKEIWEASFVFSWIMWKIVEKIKEKGKYKNIVIPYRKDLKELKSVGLYPDHLVYKCDGVENDLNIGVIVEKVKEELKTALEAALKKVDVNSFVENYFQLQYFTVDLDEEELKKERKNFLQKIDEVFYSLELQGSLQEETRALSYFSFSPVGETYKPDPFGQEMNNSQKNYCRSLEGIATCRFQKDLRFKEEYKELIQQELIPSFPNKKDNEELLGKIKDLLKQRNAEKEFKSYHKYVAVVQCDGDKMGRFNQDYIKQNPDKQAEEAIRMVSDCLFQWGEEASRKISDFGGLPVYAGGDDLLFFAPVVGIDGKGNKEGKNIVSLLKDISCLFREKMGTLAEGNPRVHLPDLSFGVTIFYYKYPLGEAQQKSLQLMYEMKKQHQGNGMNIALLKHSGSGFSVVLHFDALKRNERYCWESVFEELMKLDEEQFSEEVYSSLAYALQRDRRIFDLIGNNEKRIRQYFLRNVEGFPREEQITANGKFCPKEGADEEINFLLEAEKLVNLAFMWEGDADGSKKEIDRMRPVFDMLRMVKFLKGADYID